MSRAFGALGGEREKGTENPCYASCRGNIADAEVGETISWRAISPPASEEFGS